MCSTSLINKSILLFSLLITLVWSQARRGFLPTSTHLWLLTVHRDDTWWTVVPKKAAAVAKTSTKTTKYRLYPHKFLHMIVLHSNVNNVKTTDQSSVLLRPQGTCSKTSWRTVTSPATDDLECECTLSSESHHIFIDVHALLLHLFTSSLLQCATDEKTPVF